MIIVTASVKKFGFGTLDSDLSINIRTSFPPFLEILILSTVLQCSSVKLRYTRNRHLFLLYYYILSAPGNGVPITCKH